MPAGSLLFSQLLISPLASRPTVERPVFDGHNRFSAIRLRPDLIFAGTGQSVFPRRLACRSEPRPDGTESRLRSRAVEEEWNVLLHAEPPVPAIISYVDFRNIPTG